MMIGSWLTQAPNQAALKALKAAQKEMERHAAYEREKEEMLWARLVEMVARGEVDLHISDVEARKPLVSLTRYQHERALALLLERGAQSERPTRPTTTDNDPL